MSVCLEGNVFIDGGQGQNINITNSMVRMYVPISSNNDVTGRQIYRTQRSKK
jgi:hypothetical protein